MPVYADTYSDSYLDTYGVPAFPDPSAQLGIRLELNAGGTWTNVTSDCDHGPWIIGRGHPDESTTVSPSTFSATLSNTDARYSPDNPMAPLYPYLVQNMPGRVSIPAAVNYLRLENGNSAYATCPDSSGLHVTGDIDIRIDLKLTNWQLCDLAAKWPLSGGQQCWLWQLNGDGTMQFFWSTNGSDFPSAQSTVPLLSYAGRQSVRVTLAVASGTVTFYTGPAGGADGSVWTQLGDQVTQGATSIFAGTAALTAGNRLSGGVGLNGNVYELEVRSGIAGTVVAHPVFSAQAAGTASFTDAQSNTWSMSGTAEISDRDYRLHFETSEWPQQEPEYNPDAANNTSVPTDSLVPLVGGGLLRRLSQRAQNVQDPMYRSVLSQSPVAYWPMEDAVGSTSFGSAVGGTSMGWSGGTPVLATSSAFICSNPLPALGGAALQGRVPAYTTGGGASWAVRFLADLPSLPASGQQILFQVSCNAGLAAYITVRVDSSGNVQLTAYDGSLAVVADTGSGPLAGGILQPLLWSIEAQPSGSNVKYNLLTLAPGSSTAAVATVTSAATGAAGYVTIASPAAWGGWNDTIVGHVHVLPSFVNLFTLGPTLAAHAGEPAGTRFARLCAENSIAVRTRGNLADTTPMGAQPTGTLTTLLQACADADQGVWTELRQVLGWGYVTRKALYNQAATATLSYTSDHLSPWSTAPTRDDQVIVNDVTYTNTGGASTRAYAAAGQPITGGRMSTASPASGGVGTYAQSYSVSAASDSQLADLATWKLHIGTVDQARLPGAMIDLASGDATSIYNPVVQLDLGDRLVISNPPRRLGFEPVTQLAQALTETLFYDTFTVQVAGVPELPYEVWTTASRVESGGTTLHAGVNTTATSWQVDVTGALWSVAGGDYPLSWVVDGERVTVTAMSGGSSPQTATVVRSANGVVKSHLAGAVITLWPPPVIGL